MDPRQTRYDRTEKMNGTEKRTAFVLSGGASLGAVQAGMLRALYEREISPDLIVGTSVGAINGAFIASRPTTVETAQELAAIWRDVGRWDVFPVTPLTGFFGFIGVRDHLVADRGLRNLVRDNLEIEDINDAAIPLHVVTTDLLSGRERRLSQGDAVRAVMASAAIPGIFPPVELDSRLLVDGGVANNAPISDAIELGADRIYVLPTGNACDLAEAPRGALAMLLHAMSLLVMRRLLIEINAYQDRAELIVLPPPCPLAVSPIDFARADELMRRGYEDGLEYLESLEGGPVPVPLSMTMHDHGRRVRHQADA